MSFGHVAIIAAKATWSPNDALELYLERVSGDIIQAVQALKESRPVATEELKGLLLNLTTNLLACSAYCTDNSLSYPFDRAKRQVQDVLSIIFPDPSQGESSARQEIVDAAIDPQISACIEQFKLGPLTAPRLFNGLWQMSSPAWGSASSAKQDIALTELVRCGLVGTDMADHYGDAELIYGGFRNRLPAEVADRVLAMTKWCIFGPLEKPVTPEFVLEAVKERSRRLGGRVELLQFHWHDYASKEYLQILAELVKIAKAQPSLVSAIGLCNFDTEHTIEACEYLLKNVGEVGIVSNQVQYSLIDSRPIVDMAAVCKKYGLKLLTYGSFCGGFLSDRWLGKAAPDVYSESLGLTPSQRKYYDMISTWGSWDELQGLLRTLRRIADKHNVSTSNVATRWVLDHEEVGAVIVGTRLGVSSNVSDNLNVFSFSLSAEDKAAIDELNPPEKAKALFDRIGDCGNEYRKMH
ncbi:NADP-dependent oxidoreductase domain-containing protein [Schizophyllum fasciatum]